VHVEVAELSGFSGFTDEFGPISHRVEGEEVCDLRIHYTVFLEVERMLINDGNGVVWQHVGHRDKCTL
jgi:hypothetical protein